MGEICRENRRENREGARQLFRFVAATLLIVCEAAAFYLCWKGYYNPRLRVSYLNKGNYFVTLIYALLLLLFSRLYGGLKPWNYNTGSILLSAGAASLVTNITAYFAVIIPAATWYVSPVPVLLGLTAADIALAAVWSSLVGRMYRCLFRPLRLLLLEGESGDGIPGKFTSMKDSFTVAAVRRAGEGESAETLLKDMTDYDGVVIGDLNSSLRNDVLKRCCSARMRTFTLPKLTDVILRSGELLHIIDSPIILNRNQGLSPQQAVVKRACDLVLSFIGLIVSSPVLLVTAAAIHLEDGGPVFFRQDRCTKDGKVFSILKFRSMIVDAEKAGEVIPAREKDPRITKVGRIIRATRIDELPQLINIFLGDMSLVGPRPERVEHVAAYTAEIPEFSDRLLVKGGLTGYAQVYGKYNTGAYDKLKLDLIYIQNYSLLLDIRILLKTLQIVFTKESTEGFGTGE